MVAGHSGKLYDPPRVGGDILSYCARCDIELAHVVVSMVDRRPAKVICKTCRSEHKHRLSSSTRKPVSTAKSAYTQAHGVRASKSQITVAELWEKRISEHKTASPLPYTFQTTYCVGDLIKHPNFGVGHVEEVKRNGKITVLFRNEEKVLVHHDPNLKPLTA